MKKSMNTVKAHASTPKVTLHKNHLKNIASYTGPNHSSGKPLCMYMSKQIILCSPTAISSLKDLT